MSSKPHDDELDLDAQRARDGGGEVGFEADDGAAIGVEERRRGVGRVRGDSKDTSGTHVRRQSVVQGGSYAVWLAGASASASLHAVRVDTARLEDDPAVGMRDRS